LEYTPLALLLDTSFTNKILNITTNR